MKFRVLGTALLVLMAATAHAQSRFDVPFTFHIGDKTLAAGRYSVSSATTSGVLLIRSNAGQSMMVLPLCNVPAPKPPSADKLVFHRYGTAYFLSQVWIGGDNVGSQLRQSKAEREIASTTRSTQTTQVYASLR